MPKSVGTKTGRKTRPGKYIYKTPEGELVSEKSKTILMDDKIMNVPSIHDGQSYSVNELKEKLKQNKISPTSIHKTVQDASSEAQFRSSTLMDSEEEYGKKLSSRSGSFKRGGMCRGSKALKGKKFSGVF